MYESLGRKAFELAREVFADLTGQELFAEGWAGLTAEERQAWEELAHESEAKDRD